MKEARRPKIFANRRVFINLADLEGSGANSAKGRKREPSTYDFCTWGDGISFCCQGGGDAISGRLKSSCAEDVGLSRRPAWCCDVCNRVNNGLRAASYRSLAFMRSLQTAITIRMAPLRGLFLCSLSRKLSQEQTVSRLLDPQAWTMAVASSYERRSRLMAAAVLALTIIVFEMT